MADTAFMEDETELEQQERCWHSEAIVLKVTLISEIF